MSIRAERAEIRFGALMAPSLPSCARVSQRPQAAQRRATAATAAAARTRQNVKTSEIDAPLERTRGRSVAPSHTRIARARADTRKRCTRARARSHKSASEQPTCWPSVSGGDGAIVVVVAAAAVAHLAAAAAAARLLQNKPINKTRREYLRIALNRRRRVFTLVALARAFCSRKRVYTRVYASKRRRSASIRKTRRLKTAAV